MANPPSGLVNDPDSTETMPVADAELVPGSSAPPSCDGWDNDETPTAVQTRRPIFAPPPRLPRT